MQFNPLPVDDGYFVHQRLASKVRIWSVHVPERQGQVVDWSDLNLNDVVTAARVLVLPHEPTTRYRAGAASNT